MRKKKANVATAFKVNCDDFRMLLKRLSRFVAKDDTRPVLMSVKLDAKKAELEGVAANGFILGCQTIEYREPPKSVGEILVLPAPLLSALKTVDGNAEITITFEEVCVVEAPGINVSVSLVQGNYPDVNGLKASADLEGKVTSLSPELLKLLDFGGQATLHIQINGINGAEGIVPVATNDGFWGIIMPVFVDELNRKKQLSQAVGEKVKAGKK